MGEIRAIVLVDSQAKTTLKTSDVVFEEVGVFIEVDSLESELS